jgi:hypothetical protein
VKQACDQFKADMAGPKDGSRPPGFDVNDYRTIGRERGCADRGPCE